MERFIKGDVVVIPFPFSDLTTSKKRPALLLACSDEDIILCQITSKNVKDDYSIFLDNSFFTEGGLYKNSNIRPNRLFTANVNLIERKVGTINIDIYNKVVISICDLIKK